MECCKPHKAALRGMKYNIINDVEIFPTIHTVTKVDIINSKVHRNEDNLVTLG